MRVVPYFEIFRWPGIMRRPCSRLKTWVEEDQAMLVVSKESP